MGGTLKVSTDDLHTAGGGLRTVATEFEGLDGLMGHYDRRTVGHQGLQHQLQEFSDGWNDNRNNMIEGIKGLAETAKAAAETYDQIEKQLVDALLGKGAKR